MLLKLLSSRTARYCLLAIAAYIFARARIEGMLSIVNVAFAGAALSFAFSSEPSARTIAANAAQKQIKAARTSNPPRSIVEAKSVKTSRFTLDGRFYICAVLLFSSIISYLFGGTTGEGAVHILALLGITLFAVFTKSACNPIKTGILTSLCMIIGVSLIGVYIRADVRQLLVGYAVCAATGFCAFFAANLAEIFGQNAFFTVRDKGAFSLCAVYTVLVMTLVSFEVFFINFGIVAGTVVILAAGRKFGVSGGAAAGILTSLGVMLCSRDMGALTFFFSLTGFIAAYFSKLPKHILALMFLMLNLSGLILFGLTPSTLRISIAVSIGCIVFAGIPAAAGKALAPLFEGGEHGVSDNVRHTLAMRVEFAANTVARVNQNAEISSRVFYDYSPKTPYGNFDKNRLKALQESRFGLLEISSELMLGVRNEVGKNINYDGELEKSAISALKKAGVNISALSAYYNENGRLFIEAYVTKNEDKPPSNAVMCGVLSQKLETELAYFDTVNAGETLRYMFAAPAAYELEYRVYQSASAGKDKVSGDNYDVFYDRDGKVYIALSDGMGTGSRAALESKMLLNHVKRLIKSGISDVGLAVRIVSRLMSVKSLDEMFATLDLTRIDLDRAQGSVYKYGASATFYVKKSGTGIGREAVLIENENLPIGILDEVKLEDAVIAEETHRLEMNAGDLLVVVSDGVPETDYNSIKKLIAREYKDLYALAEKIGICARANSKDDITVICAALR